MERLDSKSALDPVQPLVDRRKRIENRRDIVGGEPLEVCHGKRASSANYRAEGPKDNGVV